MILRIQRPVILADTATSFYIAYGVRENGGAFEISHNAWIAWMIEQGQSWIKSASDEYRFWIAVQFVSDQIENFMRIELNKLQITQY